MSFNPKGKATIQKLEGENGASDDAHERIDFRLTIEDVPASVARAALGSDKDGEVEDSFFRSVSEDAERSSRYFGIKKILSNASWDNRHALAIRGLRRVRVSKISAIALLPRGRTRFDMSFKVAIESPPAGYVDTLLRMLKKPIDVEFEHDAELPLGKVGADQASMPPPPKKARDIRSGKRPAKKAASPGRSIGNKPARKKVAKKTASGTAIN